MLRVKQGQSVVDLDPMKSDPYEGKRYNEGETVPSNVPAWIDQGICEEIPDVIDIKSKKNTVTEG